MHSRLSILCILFNLSKQNFFNIKFPKRDSISKMTLLERIIVDKSQEIDSLDVFKQCIAIIPSASIFDQIFRCEALLGAVK